MDTSNYSQIEAWGKLIVFEHNLINPFTRKIVSKPENKADDVNWMLKMSDIKSYYCATLL